MASKPAHFPLGISKLKFVLQVLRYYKFPEARWFEFGLNLGLLHPTLEAIESAHRGNPSRCLMECLTKWLTKADDNVTTVGPIIWKTLANALHGMNAISISTNIRKTMADPVSELLQCYIGRLAQVVLTEESVDLLHTEGLISKDALTEVKSCGCSLVGDPMLLILSAVAEDHSKLFTLTSILVKSKEAVSLASDIIMEYGKSFPSAVTVMPSQQASTSTSSRSQQLQDSSSETELITNTEEGVIVVKVHPGYKAEFDRMGDMLGTLIYNIVPLIKAAIPSVDDLKAYLVSCCPELKPQLKDANSFDDVMRVIWGDCSVTDVALLETIVNKYSIQDAIDMILAYKTHLDEFCENKLTKLLSKRLSSSLFTCDMIKFVLEWDPNERSFSDIASLLWKTFKDNQVEVVVMKRFGGSVSYPAIETVQRLTRKKLQLEKKLKSMNENLTKQIEELKTKVVEREIIIVKLVKEKSELEEELQKDITTAKDNEKQLKEKEPVKDADIQFDYSTFPSKEETEKLKACIAMLTKEKSLFEENNEKSLGKIEKLEVGVADSLTYITTLTDEKTLINEENKKLKVQVVDKDILIAKLMKKESQLKEELQSLKNISTDTKCIQCDYWTKAELPFDGMVTLGKKVCLYNANSSHELQLDECGLTLSLPDGLLSPVDSTVYEAAAQGLWGGDFEFPAGTHLISSVCYISVSPNAAQLDKPVTVQLVHCAHLTSQFQSQYLSFVVAEVQPGKQSGPFKFELLPGGSFSPDSQTGSIELKSFSLIAIVIVVSAGVAGIVAGSGAAVGVATVGAAAVGVAKIGNLAFNAFKNVTPPVPPSFHCRGLFYKKYWTNEVIVSLAVLPDLPAFKEPFKDDPVALSLLGELRRTFPFTFSKDKNNCLKVTNIPKRNIEGWRFTGCNTEITETHVVRYSSGQSSEPPYIQISVQPDETDATEKLSHTLSVDDIQTPSGVSSVPWNIEVSKNDLSSTAFLSDTSHSPNNAANAVSTCTSLGRDIEKRLGDILRRHQAPLNNIFDLYISSIRNQLYEAGIIAQDVHRSPNYDTIIRSFLASISTMGTQSEIKNKCNKFLTALSDIGGPVADAANMLRKEWQQAMIIDQ